jgi:hypothetical protein
MSPSASPVPAERSGALLIRVWRDAGEGNSVKARLMVAERDSPADSIGTYAEVDALLDAIRRWLAANGLS